MLPDTPERRFRVTIAYDGTDYHGWQVQPGLLTIQGILEAILKNIEGRHVAVHGSGRTDAGVHAQAQIAAFSLSNPIPPENLGRALNRLLPPAIRILHICPAPLDFHPRFDAIAKTYEYRILRGEVCPPSLWRYVHHHPYPLIPAPMMECALLFEGQHDFSAFSAADTRDSPSRSKVRRIFSSRIHLTQDMLFYRVCGSGFLKHMVRRIVGTLLEAGKGNASAADILRLLESASSHPRGQSVPAKGLHLIGVEYPPPDPL